VDRKQYSKWRNKTYRQLNKRIRIQRRSVHKLQTKVNNAARVLNQRKNNVTTWTFEMVADKVISAIGLECIYDGRIVKWNNWSLDHKKPVVRGGTNAKNNIQVICKACNRSKGTFPHKLFKRLLNFMKPYPKYYRELLVRLSFGGSFHSKKGQK